MAHLTEYVKWRGDISFSEKSLTLIDNMVLCQLSYLDMKSIWPEDAEEISMTFREAVEKLDGKYDYKLAVSSADDVEFTKACAESKRFGDIRIANYVDNIDQESDQQFAAVTFYLPNGTTAIVYRGTDDTIVGWKEDFMISYTRVSSQESALEYARKVVSENESVIILGHSKGANLALYSAAYLGDKYQERLKKVYLNDGPGFCSDILDTKQIDIIKEKAVKITPEFCIVGAIFEPDIPESYIVKSSEKQLLQHDLHTWEIECGELVLLDNHDEISERISLIFDRFIVKMDMDNREIFVKRIFDTMSENGAVTIKDFVDEGASSFENLIIRLVGWNEFESNPIKQIGSGLVNDIKENEKVKSISEKTIRNKVIRCGLCFVVGLLTLSLPSVFMQIFFMGLLLVVVAFEVFQTVKKLIKSNWNLKQEKLRVYLCAILIVMYTLIIVKEGALFIIASGAIGLNFLFIAYRLLILSKSNKDNKLKRFRYIFEAIIALGDGIYIILVPEMADMWYMLITGVFLIMDSILESIGLIRLLARRKKHERIKRSRISPATVEYE